MRRIWASLVLGLLLVTGCDRGSHPGNIGKPAPQFVISDGTRTVDLSKLRGQRRGAESLGNLLRAVHRGASQPACVAEADARRGVVAVSMDQDPDLYRRFLVKHHVDVLTVRDQDRRIIALYGTAQIPETYIIDRQGVLRRKFVGAQDWTSPEITGYLSKL